MQLTADLYHLAPVPLAPGSVIEAGNFGRVVKARGWQHAYSLREIALEEARLAKYSDRPSRLECAFAWPTADEARLFRSRTEGFEQSLLYRVALCDPLQPTFVTESRLCGPQGLFRVGWADAYWIGYPEQTAVIPGIDWAVTARGILLREVLTLSDLRVEERLD